MNHLIMKQEFALRIDARVDAFRVQHDVRTYYYEKVLPILERLFDEISSSDKVIAINRLAIDLGALGWKEGRIMMDTDVIYRVCKQQLEQQLHSAIDVPKDKLVTRRTEEEHACLQWIFYMEQGVLPWALKEINHAWLVKVIHQLAIDHAMISRLRSLILVDTDALVRIVRDHDDVFLLQLAEVLTATPQPALLNTLKHRENLENGQQAEVIQRNRHWTVVLRQAAGGCIDLEKVPEPVHVLVKEVKREVNKQEIQTVEELYSPHAGLIILHPFIRQLFQRLDLLIDGQFRDGVCLQKAVAVLHFVATGRREFKEYELVVPKIICGMPLEEAMVYDGVLLTVAEESEALDMLQAAIGQWEFLGNTSVAAFREGFLDREARIGIAEQRITFRMETKGIDVLLDRLPWNLSLVKFPWLHKIINVEWR